MSLAPVDVLAASVPVLGASRRGGLDRWASAAGRTGGGLASRFDAVTLSQSSPQPSPGPVGAPLGTAVLPGPLGKPIVPAHIPLAAPPVHVEPRVADFPQVHLARATPACALLGGREQRSHDRALRVRHLRGLPLPRRAVFPHVHALLGGGKCANYLTKRLFWQALFPESLSVWQQVSLV
jgi:hypothetical protein